MNGIEYWNEWNENPMNGIENSTIGIESGLEWPQDLDESKTLTWTNGQWDCMNQWTHEQLWPRNSQLMKWSWMKQMDLEMDVNATRLRWFKYLSVNLDNENA